MAKYLIRFDDINQKMDWEKFYKIKKILEDYNIKSILGVVPRCKDDFLKVSFTLPNYYEYLRKCKSYGDSIAQHGYEHIFDTNQKGFYGSSNKSEFAGNSFQKQLEKLSLGKAILESESIWQPIFMAPNHSFDSNTVKGLKLLGFKFVLDGFSFSPFKKEGLIFIPQISSKPLPKVTPSLSQLCIHINTISDHDLRKLISFIVSNHKDFIQLKDIRVTNNFFKVIERKIVYLILKVFRLIRKFIKKFILIFDKTRCLSQRIYYAYKLRNIKIYNWHLKGTFFCRKYKMISLEIINSIKPALYIDIGCGLGELLSKVNLDKKYKLGYDKDKTLKEANIILNEDKFKFFTNEDHLLSSIDKLKTIKNEKKIVSMLNFCQDLNQDDLKVMIDKFHKRIGSYTLIIDNIYAEGKEFKNNHHNFLFNHNGLIKYLHKVDNLRSLYCIEIG